MPSLQPLVDAGVFKFKWPSALEYKLFTILQDGETTEVRGVRARDKFLKEEEGAEVVDEEDVIEPVDILYRNLNSAFNRIKEVCQHEHPLVFIGSKNNFRMKLYPDYKKSREGKPRPYYQQHTIDWITSNFESIIVDGYEEDDAVCIYQGRDTCIVGEDKDLKQMPGYHYNPVKDEKFKVGQKDGDFFLYQQILAGDSGDDIPGIKGVGMKGAEKHLAGSKSVEELYQRSLKLYKDKGMTQDDMHLTAQLVYMLRSEGDSYLHRQEVVDYAEES